MKSKRIAISRIPAEQTASQLLAEKMNRLLDGVRTRAYELFHRRGQKHGSDLEDWFQAENELGVLPVARIDDCGEEIRIRVDGSEFTADQLKVYAEPQVITVEGAAVQTVESDSPYRTDVTERSLFGRYELPVGIDTGHVTATLNKGVLEIVARKAALSVERPADDRANAEPPKKDRTAVA